MAAGVVILDQISPDVLGQFSTQVSQKLLNSPLSLEADFSLKHKSCAMISCILRL